jgi:hypothetical protein
MMGSTKVAFSGDPLKDHCWFESPWFVTEDVPSTVDRAVIERLVAPFGKVQDVRFRDERRSDSPLSMMGSTEVTFSGGGFKSPWFVFEDVPWTAP